MSNVSTYQFEGSMGIADASRLKKAMDAALEAMAYFGSSAEDMEIVSAIHVNAINEGARAFKDHERNRETNNG